MTAPSIEELRHHLVGDASSGGPLVAARGLSLGIGMVAGLALLVTAGPVSAVDPELPSKVVDIASAALGWSLLVAIIPVLLPNRFARAQVALGSLATAVALILVPEGQTRLAGLLFGVGLGLLTARGVPASIEGTVPSARGRLAAATGAGAAGAFAVAGLTVASAGVTTAAYVLAAVVIVAGVLTTVTARRPGTNDILAMQEAIGGDVGVPDRPGLAEQIRRVASRGISAPAIMAGGLAGLGVLGIPVMGRFLYVDRVADAPAQIATMLGVAGLAAAVIIFLLGSAGPALRGDSPAGRVPNSTALVAVVTAILAGSAPSRITITLAVTATFVAAGVLFARLDLAMVTVTVPSTRSLPVVLRGLLTALGALGGLAVATALDRRFGPAWAMTITGSLWLLTPLAVGRIAEALQRDVDATVATVIEAQTAQTEAAAISDGPLLSARGIDFAYGTVQILFGVDFEVNPGEVVALLGTNGAGKSTLLRVVSGLGIPSSGTVRFDGHDITYDSAARRVDLGITQIPGGKAVFGPMSVIDNLKVYGYALGADRKAVNRGIEEAFAAFPILEERKDQQAQLMSGGERQMLALSKALILQPRVLLIDELSLGLAPKIVAQLLEMVRAINARGTAVVLVEQSVNVALSLADRAYYMEKGEVKFEGPADELLASDVLRSVYLQGAAKGLA